MADNFEISGLRFWQGPPSALASRFMEVQELRSEFYEAQFLWNGRSKEEIRHYVGRLTSKDWIDPNAAVGRAARGAQRRFNSKVTAAFDERTNRLDGFMYAAENVSSRIEAGLNKLHVPAEIAVRFGDKERSKKLEAGSQYVWGSEYVTRESRAGLSTVLCALTLEAYDQSLRGSWYPWGEEILLKQSLNLWDYEPDGGDPQLIEGEKGFGPGSRPTHQERWVLLPNIKKVADRVNRIPLGSAALFLARDTMDS
jgi:hypothetical protein